LIPMRRSRKRAAVGDPFNLDDDDPVGIPDSLGHRERIEDHGFFFHGDVAVGVGRRPAQESDMDGKGVVEQKIPALDIDHRDNIFTLGLGQFVGLAAIDPGIDKGAETDMGQIARLRGIGFSGNRSPPGSWAGNRLKKKAHRSRQVERRLLPLFVYMKSGPAMISAQVPGKVVFPALWPMDETSLLPVGYHHLACSTQKMYSAFLASSLLS